MGLGDSEMTQRSFYDASLSARADLGIRDEKSKKNHSPNIQITGKTIT